MEEEFSGEGESIQYRRQGSPALVGGKIVRGGRGANPSGGGRVGGGESFRGVGESGGREFSQGGGRQKLRG